MSLELALQANTEALKALTAALTAAGVVTPAPKSVPVPAASGPTTAKVAAAAVPLPTIEESPPAAASAVVAPPASTVATDTLVTYAQVSKAITDGVKSDRDRVVALLTKYSAKRGTDLKVEQYAAFLAELS